MEEQGYFIYRILVDVGWMLWGRDLERATLSLIEEGKQRRIWYVADLLFLVE